MLKITRETWRAAVRERRLTAATLAQVTGRKERTVRSYLEGTRRPSDEWVEKVAELIDALDRVAA